MLPESSARNPLKQGSVLAAAKTDSVAREKKAPANSAGASLGSVAPAPIGAGPDQRVTLAILIVEEVGVDGSVEARIV